jgi:tetratricopeptide (TPR) repeat protein
LPLTVRLANAVNAYANYVGKLFWPINLSAFYPYRYHLPWAKTAASCGLMIAVTLGAWWQARRRPYFTMGWFWFVIGLLPVIGLIQVGNQAMADRYTYIPAIGLFVLVTWEAAERAAEHPGAQRVLGAVGIIVLVACAIDTSRQLSYWRSSRTIFTHALEAAPENAFAECSLGVILLNENHTEEAIAHFRAAIRLEPYFDRAVANIGLAYLDEGKIEAAMTNLLRAVQLAPDNPYAHYGLARAFDAQNKLDEAIPHYLAAVKLNPDLPEAQASLGAVLVAQGKPQEAEAHFETALLANPNMWEAEFQYGNALLIQGKLLEAEARYREAARLNPQLAYAELNLAVVLEREGKGGEGAMAAERAFELATNAGDTALANQLRTHLDALRVKKDAKTK